VVDGNGCRLDRVGVTFGALDRARSGALVELATGFGRQPLPSASAGRAVAQATSGVRTRALARDRTQLLASPPSKRRSRSERTAARAAAGPETNDGVTTHLAVDAVELEKVADRNCSKDGNARAPADRARNLCRPKL